MKKNFKDYREEELLNLNILWENGTTYGSVVKVLTTISKVTKTGFRINYPKAEYRLFSLDNGQQKGLKGKFYMGTISNCYIITDQERSYLIKLLKLKTERLKAVNEITSAISNGKLKELNQEELDQIVLILLGNNKED